MDNLVLTEPALLTPLQPDDSDLAHCHRASARLPFSTVGWPHELHPVLTWAESKGVLSPLLLILDMDARRQAVDASEKEQYKTWALALSLLKRFHRFASVYYGVEDPDWEEIDGEESTLSISPRIVLEPEYLHALRALVGNAEEAIEEDATLGFMLILAMRFGLRGGEAAKLKQADWLCPDGSSRIVLVRNNRMRELKTVASRRQVPLLFKLTSFEEQVIERHFEKLDANAELGSEKPLFPLLAANDNDAATKAAKHRISHQLKRSTKNARVSVHSARHSFAHMVWCMLTDVPDLICRGLFESPPDQNWMTHVRQLVLCDEGTTRRSPWAIARLMGHAHPRTALRSYVHLLPDLTSALLDKLESKRQTAYTPAASIACLDLDSCPKETDYLADVGRATSLSLRTPTVVKALQALRLVHTDARPGHIASSCDLEPRHVEWLVQSLAEVDAILARHDTFNPKGSGPSRLLSHIRYLRFEDLIERARDSSNLLWQPTETRGLEYLDVSSMVGPSRQLVLFSPAQFDFFAFVTRAWSLCANDFRIVGVRGLNPAVEEWATSHGLTPAKAEDFVYQSRRPKKRKRAVAARKTEESLSTRGPAARQKQFQADSVSIGQPPNPVRHRCVVLCAAQSSNPKWNSYELLLIVLVQLFLYKSTRSSPHATDETPSAIAS